MLPCLILSTALTLGQAEAVPAVETPPETLSASTTSTAPPPDRWLLMKALQGTWSGSLLDGNRLQISGWTDMSITASSDQTSNLPMGFNHRANDFLL